mgnify:CR=1 FL=1
MTELFATGYNGYLIKQFCSDLGSLQVQDRYNIKPLTDPFQLTPNSTVLLAGWPTHIHYESHEHIDFFHNVLKPQLTQFSQANACRIIFFGTCLEYGKKYYHCHESAPIHPTCGLGIAKALVSDYARSIGIPWYHLRIFYPYNFDKPRVGSILWHLSQHLRQNPESPFKCSAGLQIRDFFHISVLNKILMKLVCSDWDSNFNILNICSGCPRTVRDLMYRYLLYHQMTTTFAFGTYPIPSYEPADFYGSADRLSLFIEPAQLF